MKITQSDLFALADGPMLTPEQRRRLARTKQKQRGHVAPVGTGPAGETCGTCRHIVRGSRYRKCELNKANWTNGYGTDVLARDPACKKWEPEGGDNGPAI